MKKLIFIFLCLSITYNSYSQNDSIKVPNYFLGLETSLGYGAGVYQYAFNLKGGYLLSDHLVLGIQSQFVNNSPQQYDASYFFTGIFSRFNLYPDKRISPFIEGGAGFGFVDFEFDFKYNYIFSPAFTFGAGIEYKVSDRLHLELSTTGNYFFKGNRYHAIPLQIGINYRF